MSVTLGGTYDPRTLHLTFAAFYKYASRVQIYFYKLPQGAEESLVKTLTKGENDIWSITFSREELITHGMNMDYLYYGYRAWGPNWVYTEEWKKGSEQGFICDVDAQGNHFNPNKLLIDPYAREISYAPEGEKIDIDSNCYSKDCYDGNKQQNRQQDTGEIGKKSILVLDYGRPNYGIKPQRLLKDDIIYEVNLRGLSMLDGRIPQEKRGTFAGAVYQIPYLKELGITAVEFSPIHEFADEQKEERDWGYMILNYFSPNRRYSSDKSPGGPTRECKEMIKAFHASGIKIFLDVVYNHTGEGLLHRKVSQNNPTLRKDRETSIRAVCGRNLNDDHMVTKKLILDSLQYWVWEMGVDGFRCDLAPIISSANMKGNVQSNIGSTIFEEISKVLPPRCRDSANGVDLIAKFGGDKTDSNWLDKLPGDWAVWNKDFRDIVKTALNKYGVNPLSIYEISKVLSGSKVIIKKRPWNSINYVVSHDDCNSLRNLFSYNQFFHLDKTVCADQISWDQGGDLELQRKAVRNAFVLLLLSPGVPMFVGGDELFRKIPAYDIGIGKMDRVSTDSPEVYIDFNKYHKGIAHSNRKKGKAEQEVNTSQDEVAMFQFVKKLIQFRKEHECLRPAEYFTETINPQNGFADLTWHREDGAQIKGENWDESDFIAYRFNTEFEKRQHEVERISSIYIAYNRSPQERRIIFPPNLPDQGWYRVLDTDNTGGWMSEQGNFDDGNTRLGSTYTLHERSIIVLVEKRNRRGEVLHFSSPAEFANFL